MDRQQRLELIRAIAARVEAREARKHNFIPGMVTNFLTPDPEPEDLPDRVRLNRRCGRRPLYGIQED
jgi:hypothetical protein